MPECKSPGTIGRSGGAYRGRHSVVFREFRSLRRVDAPSEAQRVPRLQRWHHRRKQWLGDLAAHAFARLASIPLCARSQAPSETPHSMTVARPAVDPSGWKLLVSPPPKMCRHPEAYQAQGLPGVHSPSAQQPRQLQPHHSCRIFHLSLSIGSRKPPHSAVRRQAACDARWSP